MTTTEHQAPPTPDTTGSGSFRPDIEGMRAVAVVLVMLYHAGLPWFSGGYIGVDVFFVISGFLITGLLVRELEATHHIDLARFYARRVRRLLPAAGVLLASVAGLTILLLPVTRWINIGRDVQWSALYAVNWRFANRAVDYLAADDAASPVQHFWSLAVEEQFYLVWPLLLLVLAIGARRLSRPLRSGLLVGLVAVGAPSLWWSISLTAAEPGRAFFVSTTRVWELALGGGVAILTPHIRRLPLAPSRAVAVLGMAAILWAGVTYDDLTVFPGSAALIPVLGTVALIASGTVDRSGPIATTLGIGPMRQIGAMSYSLYLWHWPLLVVADARWGPLSWAEGLGVVAFSVLPAWLAYRYVEHRWRHSEAFVTPPRRGLMWGLTLTLVGVIAGTAIVVGAAVDDARDHQAEIATLLTDRAPQQIAGEVSPPLATVRADLPAVYADGCHQDQTRADVATCTYGDLDSAVRVVLLGDSHAAQWVPAFRALAEERGWTLQTITKSSCQFADTTLPIGDNDAPYDSCVDWNNAVIETLTESPPTLVVTTGIFWTPILGDSGLLDSDAARQELAHAYVRSWTALIDRGIQHVALRDTPYPAFDVSECVADHLDALADCAFGRTGAMAANTPQVDAAATTGVPLVDLTDHICHTDLCPAVVDDVLLWRDTHHLTATYVRALAPALEAELRRVAPVLFDG
ncbi:MAG: acyltransferase [Acidimicrobiia bacterium]|nr:acyltransferase [Acidimicrobiia bacterium]